jgi:hypothetical protein
LNLAVSGAANVYSLSVVRSGGTPPGCALILDTHFETLRTFIDGTLATAYACYKTGLSAQAVIMVVRSKWNEPYLTNSGFIDQLVEKFP